MLTDMADIAANDDSDPQSSEEAVDRLPTVTEKISLLRWHLDRYDRLRASTASRASVVLGAGAILSAGNAVVLSQLIGGSAMPLQPGALTVFSIAALISASLLMLSLLQASRVLVTARDSRSMFGSREVLPASPLFNGTDTVDLVNSFADFRTLVTTQREHAIFEAAQVELWIGIQQHRVRYRRLRNAVGLLRYAAMAFLVILASAMVVNVLLRI